MNRLEYLCDELNSGQHCLLESLILPAQNPRVVQILSASNIAP